MKYSFFSRTISKSVLSNFSREAITSFGQLLLVPLYISVFASDDYSVWLLFTSYSSFVVLSDFGLATAVLVKMHKNPPWDNQANKQLWNEYKRTTRRIASVISMVVLVLVFFSINKYNYNSHSLKFYFAIILCFLILAFQTLRQHNILYQYQMRNSYNQGMKILFRMRIFELFFTYIALLFKPDILVLLISILSLRQTLNVLQTRSDRLKDDFVQDSFKRKSHFGLNEIWEPAIGNGLLNLSILLGIHGSFTVAAMWADPESLIALSLGRMLVSPIRLVSGALSQGTLPHLIRINKDSENLSDNFQMRYILGYLSTIFITAILVFSSSKLIWAFLSRGSSNFSESLIFLYIASVVLDAICLMRFQLPMSQNRSLKLGILFLITTCLALTSQPILSDKFALNAVPISIMFGNSIFLVTSIILRRIFK